ncbi:macrophage-expressed gene 1 protein-like [Eublepharis macularius]|uniref:Macrophage-expressed gene 1 protein n=1 Tax=Eublepharis macularius TaxID=481883 RepID=A0AA97IZF9_EUBMA|nr:macrophage-expressed gene 1 protein-like [Eublepharis macularius]
MSDFMGILLFLTLMVWAIWAQEPMIRSPFAVGFQECKQTLKLPTLEVLPGGGWDNLRNLDAGRVINLNYSLCRTTEDGAYVIPNEVFTIARKQSYLEFNSEIIESWLDYQSATSVSINSELSSSYINGKFSSDFRRMKTHQVRDQAVTTRVQVRNLIYTVKFDPAAMLDEGFRQQVITIANHVEKNQTRMADYLAEILVLNYGTHVITSVDAGASLVQEDQIKSTFLKDSWSMRSSITAAAGVSFRDVVNFNSSIAAGTDDFLIKQYQSNRTNSRVESIGGLPFYPGITLKAWQESITNQLVAIDRSGLPLQFFITPNHLPELPTPLVKRLSWIVKSAIFRYYTFNTYPGCTNAASPNFNFHANTDDGTCEGTANNFTFGGAYQECAQLEGPDAAVLCQSLEQRNPLTGAFSCPVGYAPVRLSSQQRVEGYSHLDCHQDCLVWKIFCKMVCKDIFTVSKVQFSAYWCAARSQVPEKTGYLFGGLFSAKITNPMTNAQSCPSTFFQLKLFDQLKLCVSRDERGQRYSVPFGGFFSCQVGNPLVGSHNGTDNDPYPKRCPAGFSQHLAVISDGCQVEYCVKAGLFTEGPLPQARLPPFTRKPTVSLTAIDTVLVVNGNSDQTWVKDSQSKLWKPGSPTDMYNMKMASGSLSDGEAAGVTVGATTCLAILIGLAVYGCRRYKKKEYNKMKEEEKRLVSNNPLYGLMPEVEDTQLKEEERQTV